MKAIPVTAMEATSLPALSHSCVTERDETDRAVTPDH